MAFLNEEIDLCESLLARANPTRSPSMVFSTLTRPTCRRQDHNRARRQTQERVQSQAGFDRLGDRRRAQGSIAAGRRSCGERPVRSPPDGLSQPGDPGPVAGKTAQAFLISPGQLTLLPRNRTPFGTEITRGVRHHGDDPLHDRSGLRDRVERSLARVRPLAVQLAIEQAETLLQTTIDVNGRLNADGHHLITAKELKLRADAGVRSRPTDERDLLVMAESWIKSAREVQEREDFSQAWNEARRASRPLRTLMHGQWQNAFAELARVADKSFPKTPKGTLPIPLLLTPASCGPAVGFNTLPELFFWIDWIGGRTGYRFGANRLPSGDFDDPKGMADAGWVNIDYKMEGITASMATVPRDKSQTNRMIRMVVQPTSKEDLDKNVPFFDFPIAAMRSPAIPVQAKNLIRITVLVKRSIASNAGIGGIIVRDSIGGEQFQFRSAGPIPSFSRVVLYRKAPSDGNFTVTLGLAGYGEAFFDDLRVELVEANEVAGSRRRGEHRGRTGEPPLPTAVHS